MWTEYITTMVVEANDDGPGDVCIETQGLYGQSGVRVIVDRDIFLRDFHRLDRQVFHFALAVELMRLGRAVRRKGWSELAPSIAMNRDLGEIVYANDRGVPIPSLRGSCLVAEDWVAADVVSNG
jgi:hypothetical protein